ncbi:calpastatin isoform X10 [Sebastes umbrosus]|uniref:calpastatin isoform X10 n=1 Tax=Sebastes umbrosus TaxID=72105 RepID=UPI00189E0953|nr:calpastatin isoform X10 [Sebastes umbrosus]
MIHGNYRPLPLPRQNFYQSQPSQATPKPAAQVSTVKPAQFEKASSGSTMATKPGVITTATGGATRSGVTAGGSASVGTAGKAKPETNTTPAGATVIDMSSAGSTFVDMTSAGARSGPKEMSKTTAAVSQVKAAATAPSHAAGAVAVAAAGIAASIAVIKPKESPKGAAQSTTATTTVKADVHKVDPAKTFKPVASAVAGNVQATKGAKPTQTKVQVEVPPAAATGAKEVDPFDALASILPSVDPVAPIQPVYTGPEVIEPGITFERPPKCGGRDSTLPPGYRFEDMPPAPADYKPKDVPKPLSTDEALDSLSFGFTSSTVPAAPKKQEKKDSVECVSVSSADLCNFAPLPVMKAPPLVAVRLAPPVDKKAKMEKVDAKPKTDGGDSMSLDALSALVDALPKDVPKPELPKLRPEDIVSEDKHKKEKGVLVGEREDSIAPEYRFDEEELKKLPAPKPQPTIGTGEALDFLSGGFTSSSSAPAVKALPAKKTPAVPPVAVCPPADKKPKMEKVSDDFSLEAGLTSSTATNVKSSMAVCPPADKKTPAGKDATDGKLKTGQADPLDAFSALSDTLPKDAPKPELPKLRPEDIVSEDEHKKEKGVFVGERESSINPKYRFNEEELKKLPAPKPEPTIDTGEALDFLSEGFSSSSSAPAVQALPAKKTPAVPLEAGLTSSTATNVKSSMAVCPPARPAGKKTTAGKDATDGKLKTGQDDPMSLDALGALGGLLPKDAPKPELPELRPEDIVSEDEHKKEKGVLVGERESSINPKYRFNEEELKKLPAPKPEPTVDTGEALDFLSEGFSSSSSAPALQAPISSCIPPAQTKVEDLSALDLLSSDFVTPAKSAPPPTKMTPEQPSSVKVSAGKPQQAKPTTDKGTVDSMSLDALSALCDTLPEDVPKAELPELRPEDIVTEDKHTKKKGVLVGERDDSIPPEYRFKEEELKKLPAPKPEPTVGTGEALDFLSEGFTCSSSAPAVQAPVITPSAPPAQPSADLSLDPLAADFVACSAAPTVKSSACPPTQAAPELSGGADSALDALSDTLADIAPAPQPAPPPAKDIVNEKKAVEERLIKMGERDDSLPPEYRPTEEDLKKMAEEKAKAAAAPKKKTMDDKTALDLLSSDFTATAKPTAAAASCAATTKLEPPVLDSEPLKPMSGPVLDSLSSTLLPDAPEFKSKTDKPKGKSKSKSRSKKHHAEEPPATDQLSAQFSSDVVPKSTKKGGKS